MTNWQWSTCVCTCGLPGKKKTLSQHANSTQQTPPLCLTQLEAASPGVTSAEADAGNTKAVGVQRPLELRCAHDGRRGLPTRFWSGTPRDGSQYAAGGYPPEWTTTPPFKRRLDNFTKVMVRKRASPLIREPPKPPWRRKRVLQLKTSLGCLVPSKVRS
jgi:hypothetical protein